MGRRRKKTLRRWVFPDALIKKTYTAGGVESVQFRKCDHYAAARCVWHSCPQRRPKYRAHPCLSLSFKFSLFYELKCTSLICKKRDTPGVFKKFFLGVKFTFIIQNLLLDLFGNLSGISYKNVLLIYVPFHWNPKSTSILKIYFLNQNPYYMHVFLVEKAGNFTIRFSIWAWLF